MKPSAQELLVGFWVFLRFRFIRVWGLGVCRVFEFSGFEVEGFLGFTGFRAQGFLGCRA